MFNTYNGYITAIADLVRLCHCNPHALSRIATEFQHYWDLKIKNDLPPGAGPVDEGGLSDKFIRLYFLFYLSYFRQRRFVWL